MKEHYFFVHDFLYVFGIGLYACKIKYLFKKKKDIWELSPCYEKKNYNTVECIPTTFR